MLTGCPKGAGLPGLQFSGRMCSTHLTKTILLMYLMYYVKSIMCRIPTSGRIVNQCPLKIVPSITILLIRLQAEVIDSNENKPNVFKVSLITSKFNYKVEVLITICCSILCVQI